MNRSAPLLLAAVVAAGCGGSVLPPRNGADNTEVAELKQRILELQRRAAVQQVELARLRERVAELEARAGGAEFQSRAGGATSARPAPPASVRSAPARPVAPEGRAAEPEPAFEIAEVLEDEEIDPDELEDVDVAEPAAPPPGRREPPAAGAPGTRTTLPAPAAPPPAGDASGPPSPAAQALYDQGYTLFHQGRFIDAESAFRRFLQEHPDNDHADNAQYWIGEARYARDDLRGALAAFRETVQRHPHGNKVPDALLKAGQCLEKLGDHEGARETYRELVRRFPESAAAVVAEERLSS